MSPSPTGPIYELRRDIKLCRRCPLCHERANAVPGEGPTDAQIVLVGESPSGSDDKEGTPFVGKAGQKLDQWLEKAGLSRDDIFVTNILKCSSDGRFPEDKPDGPAERCRPWLVQQLQVINPLAIVVCGKQALHHLVLKGSGDRVLGLDEWAGLVLRRRDMFGETRIGVIYHPTYILKSRNIIEEDKCVRTLKTIAAYVAARRRRDQPAMIDLKDVRPVMPPVFQQRFRVLGPPVQPKVEPK